MAVKGGLPKRAISTSLVLVVLLLAAPVSMQARMQCGRGNQVGISQSSRSTANNLTIEHYKFDVVPCADETPGRRNNDSNLHLKTVEEAASSIAWIVEKTGWTVREAPLIRFLPYAELVKIFSGGKATDYHVDALYSETDHTIYLPDSWRPDDLHDRSILLHEVVHHLQYLNNVKVTCQTEYEYQAIELQVTWLREQGVDDPLDLLHINPLFILMLRQCGD
jgi:hypothetical protein